MNWAALNKVLNGIIGKSLFFISLAIPASKLLDFGIPVGNYPFYLLGSILIAVCYILNLALTPELISEHKSFVNYYEHLAKLHSDEALDVFNEFGMLESLCEDDNKIVCKLYPKFSLCIPIEDGIKTLGEKKALYGFAGAKYAVLNNINFKTRCFLTCLVFIGFSFLYFPLLIAITKIGGSSL